MKKQLLALVVTLMAGIMSSFAAIFTTSPKLLQEASKDVKIYFDPNAEGVPAALKSASEVYAHIGVTLTSDPSSWQYVIGAWADKNPKKKFVKQSNGLWMLEIGDIRSFFGISKASDVVAKIAIIALDATGSTQTGDNFIDVLEPGFQMGISYNTTSLVISSPKTINFTVDVTEASQITLSVNGTQIGSTFGMSLSKGYNFDKQGQFYTVTATAKSGNNTLTKELTVAFPQPSAQANYPGGVPKQGAVRNSDGTVTFCLAAPNKQSVILVPSWDDYQTLNKNVMKYQDYQGFRYFWITTTDKLDNNKYYPYYYLVDGTIKVADPYARLILDNYSDKWMSRDIFPDMPKYPYEKFDDTMLAVYRGDIDDYNWDSATLNFQIPDHKCLNIYELLLRDFTGDGSDQDGKTFGTLKKAMGKIPYLKTLGINCIELLPVMEFNGNSSWGYNNNAYMALDKVYGSPKDMRDFVAECHRQGIAVVLDIVFNQSDGLHPWYQMYDIDNNPFYNKTAPHAYSVLNDWNQDCQLVRQHWKDVLKYWMEAYKVDGFRFDLVKGLGSNSSYGSGTDNYNASRVANMKELHAAIKAVNPNGIHINELLGQASENNALGQDGQLNWNKVSNGAYQYAMGYASGAGDTKGFYAPNWGMRVGETVDYAESHDETRVANKVKKNGVAAVKYSTDDPKNTSVRRLGSTAAMMLMTPGSKMIWQFGEIGADDDLGSELDKLRAIAPKWGQMEVATRAGLLENYKQMLQLRLKNPEMFNGSATVALSGFNNDVTTVRSIRLTNGNKEIIAVFNPKISGADANVTVSTTKLNANNYQLVTCGYDTNPTLSGTGTSVTVKVPAHSFAVYATQAVTGIDEIGDDFVADNVIVYTEPGRIIVEGDYNSVEVFNMQGIQSNTFNVAPGIYIVRVDGKSFKVAVK